MLRLPVFVATSGVLGVTAHTAANGMLPAAPGLLLGLAAVAGLGALAGRRELTFEPLTALLVAAQAVLHVVLGLTGAGPTSAGPTAAGHHAGVLSVAALYPGHAMLLAHLLAAGVAGWWLAHGEAAVWSAARRVLTVVRLLRPAPLPVVRRTPSMPRTAVAVLRPQVRDAAVHPRRGPPARAALV